MNHEDKNAAMYSGGAVPLSNLRNGSKTGGDYGAMTPPLTDNNELGKDPLAGYDADETDTSSTFSSNVPHGIQKVEAAQAVWTKKTRWILFGA